MAARKSVSKKAQAKVVQKTGGDKGSKNTNDFETSGRDLDAGKGRQRSNNRKASRTANANLSGPATSTVTDNGKGAGAARAKADNRTKNSSQEAAVPALGSDKKLRKTSKRESGSRKPGTEVTKKEQGAARSRSAS